MKKIKLAVAIVAAIQCFNLSMFAANAETVEKIVAIVGSDVVTLYDLDRAMAPKIGEIQKSADKESKYKTVKSEVLDGLISDALLKQAIENSKMTVTNDDIARQIKFILAQNGVSIDVLKKELASKGIPYESYKEDVKKNLMRMKFVNQEIGSKVKITDQELKDYYEKNMGEFGAHQSVRIAQIVLPFEEVTSKEKAIELKAKASDIVRQLKGGASFSALAKENSKGPNAENGGDLGIIDPTNLMPDVQTTLEKLKIGQVSEPIVTPAGILIIKLLDRAKATVEDFDKLKDKIYNKMYDQRVTEELQQYLNELRKKTYVEIKK